MSNKIRLTVGGIQYSIISEDSQEYLTQLGRELERQLDYLAKRNPFLSTTMIAVLAALDGMDSSKKTNLENEGLRGEINRLNEELTIARSEAAAAQRKLEAYGSQNDRRY